jgi:arsenate reductase
MIRNTNTIFSELNHTIESLDTSNIPKERLSTLSLLIDFIQDKKDAGELINLNFVCTHNSRRSHLTQIWAQALASYFNISNVYCYSGGTEATALFPKVAETLKKSGFEIAKLSSEVNPVYSIKFGEEIHPVIGFSKVYDHPFNPKSNFAAIMTCSHADENCPFIPGAEKRIPLTFADPKELDNTPLQNQKYSERSLQIATELFYVFSKIN